jgi:transcriptional regulator with XRE-family HTH domain
MEHDLGKTARDKMVEQQRQEVAELDRAVGALLREVRERRGLSQADIVRAVEERGVAWHQTTVAKIEAGTRPLKASEALALAFSLQMAVGDVLNPRGAKLTRNAEYIAGAVMELKGMETYLQRRLKALYNDPNLDLEDPEMLLGEAVDRDGGH